MFMALLYYVVIVYVSDMILSQVDPSVDVIVGVVYIVMIIVMLVT